MSRFHSYILSAAKIINAYNGAGPFVPHLKNFFSNEKKYGSRDRKIIASLCYAYFRLGHACKTSTTEERILMGLFFSENKSNDVLNALRPEWNEQVMLPATNKLSLLGISVNDIFPFSDQLGNNIDKELFSLSFLQQPDLFLRIRPGKNNIVPELLARAGIPFETTGERCLRFENNTPLDKILRLNKDAVVQDMNSQQVLKYVETNPPSFLPGDKITAWDCCAASGGKSILLNDILNSNVKLTVSDIRDNILANLEKRFREAGINIYRKFTADLSKSLPGGIDDFPLIICDVPCTGSGTWSRTPEQLFYFDADSIKSYAERQKNIVSNTITHLKAGGLFFYITCSVFKQENEDLVNYIKEKFSLPVLQMEYLEGYNKKADTMFVAVLSV